MSKKGDASNAEREIQKIRKDVEAKREKLYKDVKVKTKEMHATK